MGYTIDSITTETYGMYVSTSVGLLNLPESKEQLFSVYGKEGYQITKRKGNELDLKGFIVADDLADFKTKVASLYGVFSAAGLRTIVDNYGNTFDCFCKEGFKIDKVYVLASVFAQIQLKLVIVNE